MRECDITRDECPKQASCGWLLGILGIVGGLYVLGRRERPAERQVAVEEIDEPVVTEAWRTVTKLPQFRFMWHYVAHKALQGRQGVRVLDVGCGAGQLAMNLSKQPEVLSVTGIDLSHELIMQARQTAEERGLDVTFDQVDAANMPFSDASFDIVVSTISLHHWQDPVRVLQEIQRVLTPGGRVFIFDLRRDATPIAWGAAYLVSRYLAPRAIRDAGEPLSSFQSAYTPCEAILLAVKAGWREPVVSQGPVWLALELQKDIQEE
ncbi:MAG TPA: class I SAM-dependent methyltransferase [Armatimonadota bacterium]|nr:class I SAM-dependent methyltransferase [Armatimonadota bacterium]